MNENEITKLYNALISKGYSAETIGDEQTFMSKMGDSKNRKKLFDYVSSQGNFRIGDYNTYEKRLAGSISQKEEEYPQAVIDAHNDPNNVAPHYKDIATINQQYQQMQQAKSDIQADQAANMGQFGYANMVSTPNGMMPDLRSGGRKDKPKEPTNEAQERPQTAYPFATEQNFNDQAWNIAHMNDSEKRNNVRFDYRHPENNYINPAAQKSEDYQNVAEGMKRVKEDEEILKNVTLKPENTTQDVFDNAMMRFSNTEQGIAMQDEANEAMSQHIGTLQDEFIRSKEYKDIMSQKPTTQEEAEQLSQQLNDAFQAKYGEEIEKFMQPYQDKMMDAVQSRYGGSISEGMKKVQSEAAGNQLSDLQSRVDELQEKRGQTASGTLRAANHLLEQSQELLDAVNRNDTNFIKELGHGFWDNLDARNFTLGLSDVVDSANLKKALEAAEKGETLSKEQEALLEASAINMAIQGYFGSDLSRGYKAGMTTAESIPFMLEFIANPISGSGNAMAKSLLKWGMKRFGSKVAKSGVAKFAAREIADIVAAEGMALTTGLPGIMADVQDRLNSNFNVTMDADGKAHVERVGNTSVTEAINDAFRSRVFENQSEMVFNGLKGFNPLGNVMSAVVPKQVSNVIHAIGKTGVGRAFKGIANNRTMRELAERAQFHGFWEEYLEEVERNFLDVAVGEMTTKEALNLDQNIDIALGLAPTSVFFGVLGVGGYARENYRNKKAMNEAFGQMNNEQKAQLQELQDMAGGNQKEAINRQVKKFLQQTITADNLTQEEKRAEIQYLFEFVKQNAINEIDAERTTEERAISDAEEANMEGYETTDPEAMNAAKTDYDAALSEMQNIFSPEAIAAIDENPTEELRLTFNNPSYTPEERQQVLDYVNAKQKYDGMIQRVRDDIDGQIEAASAEIDSEVNTGTGMVQPATLKTDNRQVHILDGDVVMMEDGSGIDTQKSTKDIIIRDAETGKVEFVSPADILSVDDAIEPDALKAQTAENIRQTMGQQAAEQIDGTLTFNQGDTYNGVGAEGQPATIQILADNGDGTVMVAIDGQPASQPMQKEAIQQMVDNAKMQQAQARREEARAAQAAQPSETQGYALNQEVNVTLPNGQQGTAFIQSEQNADGNYEVVLRDANGNESVQLMNAEQLNAMQQPAQEIGTEAAVEEPAGESAGENVQQAVPEETPATSESEAMPMIGEGEDMEPDFAHVSPQRTQQYLYDESGLEQDEADDFVKDMQKQAGKDLQALQKKKPKLADKGIDNKIPKFQKAKAAWQQQVDDAERKVAYWNSVEQEQQMKLRQAKERAEAERVSAMTEGEKLAQERLAQETPETLEEVAAQMLGTQSIKLLWDEFKKETGFGTEEARKFFRIFAKDGMSLRKAGEQVEEAARNYGIRFDELDANAGRNAVISALHSSGTWGDLLHLIERNRQAEADALKREEERYNEELRESWAQENFGMSYDEYEDYEKEFLPQYTKEMAEATNEEYYAAISDEINNLNEIDNGERTDVSESEGSPAILPEEQPSVEGGEGTVEGQVESKGSAGEVPAEERPVPETAPAGEVEQTKSNIQGLENYSEDEIADMVRDHVERLMEGEDFQITDIKVIGSRTRGEAREDSDLDVLVEYKGGMKEDAAFNMLNDEGNRLTIEGIPVDINPITEGKSGTIEQWMKRNADYKKDIVTARKEVAQSPTEAQKEAGNYKKGHIKLDGYDITIENPKGSTRSGVDEQGKEWSVTMNNDYGYLRGTEGVDGDHIDVFLSDNPTEGNVFVVDQVKPDGSFDEHKVMYGFATADEARAAYLANYSPGWTGLGAITEVSKDEFKKWVESSRRKTKPFAEYKSVKPTENVFYNNQGEPFKFNDLGICLNPNVVTVGNWKLGYEVRTARDENGWHSAYSVRGNTWVASHGVSKKDKAFATEEEAQSDAEKGILKQLQLHKGEKGVDALIKKLQDKKEVSTAEQSNSEQENKLRDYLRETLYYNSIEDNPNVVGSMTADELKSLDESFDNWQEINDKYGEALEENKDALKSKDKSVREAAEKVVNAAQEKANKAFEPIAKIINKVRERLELDVIPTDKKSSDSYVVLNGEGYTIAPAIYTKKNGSTLDMHLVKFDNLTDEQKKTASGLARQMKGWWDKNEGGFMMRSLDDAQKLANSFDNSPKQEAKSEKKEKDKKQEENKPVQPKVEAPESVEQPTTPSGNKLVTDARYEELKERMRKKLGGQMNLGIDPEILTIGIEMAVYHIEKGSRKFADYAKAMIKDLGDAIRPYLKAFYNGARDLPEVEESGLAAEMDSADDVRKFDVANFDKPVVDSLATAETVIREEEVKEEAKEAVDKITEPAPERKLRPATEEDLAGNPVVFYKGRGYGILMLIHQGSQVSATEFEKPKVTGVVLHNGETVKLSDLMVEDNGETPTSEQQPKSESKPKGKKGTPWWSDKNMPKSINKKDYRTYMTPEAIEYFANYKSEDGSVDFTKWSHPDLSFITAAAWDGVIIPYEVIRDIPAIKEAQSRVDAKNGSLNVNDNEKQRLVDRLLDSEHGSQVYKDGKKVKGDYSGAVRQERKAMIVIGRPAGGKSSVFADRLSHDFGARIVDSDIVKPWLKGYDDGYGAGYVQTASADIANQAMLVAAKRGDNMVIPRIGGESVVKKVALKLVEMGYDVQLYYNDVSPETSIMRASSRFAEEGRYLSLKYLTDIKDKPYKTFINFAEKKLKDYYGEQESNSDRQPSIGSQRPDENVLGTRGSIGQGTEPARSGESGSVPPVVQTGLQLGGERRGSNKLASGERIFSYAEWKSNDVAFGEKPKEIWNSESGLPMPKIETKEVKETPKKKKQDKNQLSLDLFAQVEAENESDNQNNNNNGLNRTDESSSERPSANGVRPEQGNQGVREATGEEAGQEGGRTDRGRAGRSDEGNRSVRSGLPDAVEQPKNTRNFHIERGQSLAPTTPKARYDANIAAIKKMQDLMERGAEATPTDMKVLAKFSGWGGLGGFLNDYTTKRQLQELLGEDGYQQAAMSANSAFYTPAGIIDTLWDVAKRLGFKGGNVLEGSAGIGDIIGHMPTDMSQRSNIEAVEIDEVTGNILKLLYPDAKVNVQGFEQTKIANGSVDLAITNVPFVTGLKVFDDSGDKDLSKRFGNIHDFCIAKNVRKLREGGIGIFITSNGTMDKSNDLRAWVTNEGGSDFIGAFRLNNKTFGGTSVTSDIIIIRKRVNGQQSDQAINAGDVSAERTAEYETGETKRKNGAVVPVVKTLSMTYNKYFMDHPENMAGKMDFGFEHGDTYRPESVGLFPDGKDQDKMLSEWLDRLPSEKDLQQATTTTKAQADNAEVVGENIKEGQLITNSKDEICISRSGVAVPLGVNANKVKGHTKKECLQSYDNIKKALNDVLEYQVNNEDDKGLKPLLATLNKAYDDFVKTYGYLNRNTSISFLRNDVDFSNIAALESYEERGDKNGGKKIEVKKSQVFNGRVVNKEAEPQPKTVEEAVIASIFKHGRLNVPYMAEKLGKSEDAIKEEIINSGLGFENPLTTELEVSFEYLSGNVREKLEQAIEANEDGRFDKNIKALEKVIPMDIPAHLIEFSLGSSWIDPKLYQDYVKDRTGKDVTLTRAGGSWAMNVGYGYSEKNNTFGVRSEMLRKVIPGTELIDAAMNNKTITVKETHKDRYSGQTETIVDKEATQACANKIDEIRQDFKDWARAKMQSDPELSEKISKVYNAKFNNYVPRSIPENFVPEHFAGASANIKLREHQGKAAVRATMQPVLLAHEVGTGKTFTMITAAMEMRRLGLATKPMIVVQNATTGQFASEAKNLYPNAKVLTLDEADRTAEGRKNFYAKIKYNDWDMIIVPQSVFDRIPDSEERQIAYIQDKIAEKMSVLEEIANNDDSGMITRRAEKEIEELQADLSVLADKLSDKKKKKDEKREAKTKQNAEVRAKEMLDREVDDVENFDDMEIDAVLIDEAHEYKHLGFATAMQRGVKGVDPSYSKKAQGAYLKIQAVKERKNGKNVVMATGTPISNTAAEVWTFMRYLMPKELLQEYDIYYFDDFVRNFGNISQMLEFATNGRFKENNRFAGYSNLPELIRIWSSVADTVLTKEAGEVQKKIPALETGKAQDIYLPQSRSLRSIMAAVKAELKRYDNMSGKEKKANSHIPLTMYGIAKAAAIDPRLVSNDNVDEPMSKTNKVVEETLRSLNDTKDYNGTVAIFCDNYQNKNTGFNLYEEIKRKLVANGVPEEQVFIMRSGLNDKKKTEVFDKINRGEIRVVLGSTFTLGTGVNIQERLHTLIHVDAPNRPMDYTQRNGRILRQGNLHKDWGKPVRVLRFGVEDSLDVTAYQRLKTKGAIADSVMNGKTMMNNNQENRYIEEEEDVFGDTVAQLSGSEYAMLKNQAEKELRKLQSKKQQHSADQIYVHNAIPRYEGQIKSAKDRLQKAEDGLKFVEKTFPDGKYKTIMVGKSQFSSVDAMGDFLKDVVNKRLRETEETLRNKYGDGSATVDYTVTIDGLPFEVHTELRKESEWRNHTMTSVVHTTMTYSCKELGLESVPVSRGSFRNALLDITENVITGKEQRLHV